MRDRGHGSRGSWKGAMIRGKESGNNILRDVLADIGPETAVFTDSVANPAHLMAKIIKKVAEVPKNKQEDAMRELEDSIDK